MHVYPVGGNDSVDIEASIRQGISLSNAVNITVDEQRCRAMMLLAGAHLGSFAPDKTDKQIALVVNGLDDPLSHFHIPSETDKNLKIYLNKLLGKNFLIPTSKEVAISLQHEFNATTDMNILSFARMLAYLAYSGGGDDRERGEKSINDKDHLMILQQYDNLRLRLVIKERLSEIDAHIHLLETLIPHVALGKMAGSPDTTGDEYFSGSEEHPLFIIANRVIGFVREGHSQSKLFTLRDLILCGCSSGNKPCIVDFYKEI